jgi:predicted amidohydrolase YtcJ
MLERNIFEIAPEDIRTVRVRLTVVGGRKVFDGTR